jgi:alkylhydroperoxidase/carboxymuconolactone decarboxylase family protein YurZ
MTDETASRRQGVLDGLAIYAGLRGTGRAEAMRRTVDSGDVGSTMTAMSMEFVFGQVWSRDVLDAKQRSLVTIGILIALRQTEELKNHIRIGLTNGLSVHQIEEATIQGRPPMPAFPPPTRRAMPSSTCYCKTHRKRSIRTRFAMRLKSV